LKALGILGEKKLAEYGGRIIKPIKNFVEKQGLEGRLNRKLNKSDTRSDKVIEIADDEEEDDEFENGIDYSEIDLESKFPGL